MDGELLSLRMIVACSSRREQDLLRRAAAAATVPIGRKARATE